MAKETLPIDPKRKETVAVGRLVRKGGSSMDAVHGKNSTSLFNVKIKKKKQVHTDNTLLSRYELKYRIPEHKARAVAKYVNAYIHQDKYTKLQPTGQYPIVSLYLDSDRLTLCRETLEGKKNRFKLRIRSYSDDPKSPCFFEIKRRINNVIIKSRVRVDRSDINGMLNHGIVPPDINRHDLKSFNQFMMYTRFIGAAPIVKVRYMRQAFEGDSDNRVRITFDRQLYVNPTRQTDVSLNGLGWLNVHVPFVVMEIKFTAKYPAWISRMTRHFDLKQTAMSKYVNSVKHSSKMGAAERLFPVEM